jgi:hypothetical protein
MEPGGGDSDDKHGQAREVYVVKADSDILDKAAGSVCCAPAAGTEGAQPAAAACC